MLGKLFVAERIVRLKRIFLVAYIFWPDSVALLLTSYMLAGFCNYHPSIVPTWHRRLKSRNAALSAFQLTNYVFALRPRA